MSQRWRTQKRASAITPADPDDVVANHNNVDTSPQDNSPIMGGVTMAYLFNQDFPVQKELIHVEADSTTPQPVPIGSIKDQIDYEVGGQRGLVNNVPYSEGVVSSDLVENFTLDGRQAVIRRMADKNSTGPVGTSDHNMLLALAYAQAANQYFPNEASQSDVVRAV